MVTYLGNPSKVEKVWKIPHLGGSGPGHFPHIVYKMHFKPFWTMFLKVFGWVQYTQEKSVKKWIWN